MTLLNVLEHLRDPRGMLVRLRELMAPDGLLAVVVPDARFHALLGGARLALKVSDPYWQPACTSGASFSPALAE